MLTGSSIPTGDQQLEALGFIAIRGLVEYKAIEPYTAAQLIEIDDSLAPVFGSLQQPSSFKTHVMRADKQSDSS